MAAIFLEENSIVLAAANKMVSLGKEAAERIVAGRESKSQDKTIDQILKLLTVYRNKASLSTDDLESILYDLKGLSEADSFPTISPIVGQELVYLVNEESGGGTGTLQIQNNSSDLPIRSTLNFYTILQAVDAGGKTNVGIIPGTDGYVLTMDSGVAQWLPVSGGHVIENYGTPLTQRDNINVSNGLTAVDNTPDTDFKLGGELVEQTQIETTGFDFSIGNIATGDGIIQLIDNGTDADIQLEQSDFSFRLYGPTNGSTATFTDSRGTTLGIQYAADYSAGFNARSLIDKGYADATYAPISGGTYWSLASGGTLTGNNTITGTGYTLKGIWNGLANAQTNGYGLWLANTTAAASGAANQQWSPSLVLEGQGWSGGGATQSIKFVVTTIPVSGQTGELLISSSVNGGANVSRLGIGASSSISFYQSGYGTWSVSTGAVVSGDSGDAEFVHAANYGFIFSPSNYVSGGSLTLNRLGNLLLGPRGSAPAAKWEVTQRALSSAWLPSLKVTPGAHTSMTAATEFVSNDFAGASQQWLAGTVATQRFNYFRGFTVTGASATNTITNAYTLYVDSPVAGTNAAITNNFSAGFAGNVAFYDAAGANLNYLQVVGATFRIRGASTTVIYSGANTLATFSARNLTIGQASASSGWTGALTITPGLFSSITASTELVGNDFQGNTWQWLAGTVATQRFNYFRGFTVTGASATATFTNAYTLYVDPPVAGTNATITNNWAAGFNGDTYIAGNTFIASSGTITASTKLDVRGISSGNIFVGKSNGGTQRFVLTDGGSLIHNETAVFGNTAVDADSTVTINQNKSLNGIRIDGAALTSSAPSGVYDIATWTTTTASSDTYYKLYLSGTINATNGAHRFNGVFVNPTFTALSSDAIGFGYQPTVTSVLGNNIALWADNGGLTFNGKTSPSQITSNQNDYNPTGLHHNLHIRLNSDASRDITGIVAGINGEMLVLHNIGSFNIVLKDESGSSSAANRLALNADITLLPDQSIWLWYDSTSTRWRAINA